MASNRVASRTAVPYSIQENGIDLTVARDRFEVAGANQPIWAVSVRRLAIVGSVQLHIGQRGQPITMRQGNRIVCRHFPILGGIYITSPAGAAGALAEILTVGDANDGDDNGPAFEVLEQ